VFYGRVSSVSSTTAFEGGGMKLTEKLNYLQNNHMGQWLKIRQDVENELSNQQEMFCICGRLATGLHEQNCRKFNNKITSETVKRLKHLFTKRNISC